jgi:hypothetical protein
MPGQPPQAYVDAYWADVAEELERTHHAPPADIPAAIAEFRQHMAPAGQTLYNNSPERIARTMVGHGYFDSVPAAGLGLRVFFKLTDPVKVLDDPAAVAIMAAGLIDALDQMERALGGEGLRRDETEALPGQVIVSLMPVQALGAADRLAKVANAVGQASQAADTNLTQEVRKRETAGEKVFVVPYFKSQAA